MTTRPGPVEDLTSGERRALLATLLEERASGARSYPLSSGQQALWITHQRDPEHAAYNIGLAARIRTQVDVAALGRSLRTLVDRHAALRTTFTTRDGLPVQIVHAVSSVPFAQVDAAGWSAIALQAGLDTAIRVPFDLAHGPLVRVTLFRCAPDDCVVLFAMHHIVSDGWSCGVLMVELGTLYTAESSHQPVKLPPPRQDYSDFVAWQSRMLAGSDGAAHREYWHRQLAGTLPLLDLPVDRPRRTQRRGRGASVGFKIEAGLTTRLRAFARAERVGLYTLMLGVFQVLLHRYSGQDDIIVGSPMAGRGRSEFDGTVGYFVSPVAIRADFSCRPTFRAWLGQLRTTVHEALAHQDYPFPRLVSDLQPTRDPSRSPVFDVMFNLLKIERLGLAAVDNVTSASHAGLALELVPVRQEEGQFDLALELGESDAELFGVWKYDADLFDEQTIDAMCAHYRTLLESVLSAPESSVVSLPMLTSSQRARLLVSWNDTAVERAPSAPIHQLFEEQVQRTPDAVAAVFETNSASYSELNAAANRLAHRLRAGGVGPGVLVGIAVERSLEMLVSVLAVLKTGGAYVPLDPSYPADRRKFMLVDSGAAVLLVDESVAEAATTWSHPGVEVLNLMAEREAIERLPSSNIPPSVGADGLAYVIYTSGSTGRPKGVQVPHSAVVNFLQSMRHTPGLTVDDTLLAITTLSFDIAVLELLLPLVVGATVVIAPGEVAADGAALQRALVDCGATAMQATPVSWRMLLDAGWDGTPRLKALCGGEPLPPDLATRLLERGVELWNMYGPTETTVYSTVHHVTSGEAPVSIGRPIDNTRVYVLNAELQPAPIGVAGELYIAGDGVGQGYLNRPQLTRERFVADPFADGASERMYRTGDLVRWLADGTLEHLGRLDTQVKVRGFRIELGEIETILAEHPDICQAVVVARDTNGQRRLVAYFTLNDAAAPSVDELRRHVRNQLPEYMVPAIFVTLDALPMTPNAKVDRGALPPPGDERPELDTMYVAPRNDMEREVAAVWQDLLQVTRVGVHDSFFDLGGDSLLMVRAQHRLARTLGSAISIAMLFQHPTVESLARGLRQPDTRSDRVLRAQDRAHRQRAAMEHSRRRQGDAEHGKGGA